MKRGRRDSALTTLPPAVRHLLETGELASGRGMPGLVQAFRLMKPGANGRANLRELWVTVRGEMLEEWRRTHDDDDLPWAAQEFDDQEIAGETTDV